MPQTRPESGVWGSAEPSGRVSEPGRDGFSRPAVTALPSAASAQRAFQEMGLLTHVNGKGAGTAWGGEPESLRVAGHSRPRRHRPRGRGQAGGAQMPWWAARTRVPGAPGEIHRQGQGSGLGDPPTARSRSGPRWRRTPQDPGTAESPPASDPPWARAHLAHRRRWSARRWPCRPRRSAASPDPRWPWWRRLCRAHSPAPRRRCRRARPAPCAPPRAV